MGAVVMWVLSSRHICVVQTGARFLCGATNSSRDTRQTDAQDRRTNVARARRYLLTRVPGFFLTLCV
jgi:hypothetical protein